MTDYFALLQQPRKPWLDPEKLRERYQKLARTEHPDQSGRRTEASHPLGASTFADINEAYRVLSDPRLRSQHLLSLEGKPPGAGGSPSPDLMDLFSQTATLVNEIDRVLDKLKSTDSALGKSLLQQELLSARLCVDVFLAELGKHREDNIQELQTLDKLWNRGAADTLEKLGELANRFGYLDRWINQLRERQFHLKNG